MKNKDKNCRPWTTGFVRLGMDDLDYLDDLDELDELDRNMSDRRVQIVQIVQIVQACPFRVVQQPSVQFVHLRKKVQSSEGQISSFILLPSSFILHPFLFYSPTFQRTNCFTLSGFPASLACFSTSCSMVMLSSRMKNCLVRQAVS